MQLFNDNCLKVLPTIPDKSIDLILTDPPYGTIKNAPSTWKKKTFWDNKIDIKKMFEATNRVLKENSCMILFSQDPYTFELSTYKHKHLKYSYRYTWIKDKFGNHLGSKKFPVNFTEDVCVFFKREENKENHILSEYFLNELKKSKISIKEICVLLNTTNATHYFTKGKQFRIPNKEKYLKLQLVTNFFKMDYNELSKLYFDFNNNKRKTIFNLEKDKKYKSNLLIYNKDKTKYHTTQKPINLLEDLIKTYTNENDTVLDFTMGSGSTGVACKNLNREFIGIELDKNFFNIAKNRIESTLF